MLFALTGALVATLNGASDLLDPRGQASVVLTAIMSLAVLFWNLVLSRTVHAWLVLYSWFVLFFLLIAALHQVGQGVWPGTTSYVDERYVNLAFMCIALGSSLTYFAYWLARASLWNLGGTATEGPVAAPVPEDSRLRSALLVSALLLIAYIVILGPGSFVVSRQWLDESLSQVSQQRFVVATFRNGMTFPAAISIAYVLSTRMRAAPLDRALLGFLGLGLAVAVNPISSPRILFGTVWGGILLSWALRRGVSYYRAWVSLFLVGMTLLFPIADAFRRDDTGGSLSLLGNLLESDFDGFAQIANSLAYVDAEGSLKFFGFVGVALFFIPRAFWPGKVPDSGGLLGDYFGYPISNVSAPLWAEGLLNGGFMGVVLISLLFGFVAGRADADLENFALGGKSRTGTLVAMFGAPYSLILLRGSLLQAISVLFVIVFTSWLLKYYVTQRSNVQ